MSDAERAGLAQEIAVYYKYHHMEAKSNVWCQKMADYSTPGDNLWTHGYWCMGENYLALSGQAKGAEQVELRNEAIAAYKKVAEIEVRPGSLAEKIRKQAGDRLADFKRQ